MGTRVTRKHKTHLLAIGKALIGEQIHLVLQGGQTRTGIIQALSEDYILIQDLNLQWYNRKRQEHRLDWGMVKEAFLDVNSDW